MTSSSPRTVAYFYDSDVGNFHFGKVVSLSTIF